jgi:hypothetical protein
METRSTEIVLLVFEIEFPIPFLKDTIQKGGKRFLLILDSNQMGARGHRRTSREADQIGGFH